MRNRPVEHKEHLRWSHPAWLTSRCSESKYAAQWALTVEVWRRWVDKLNPTVGVGFCESSPQQEIYRACSLLVETLHFDTVPLRTPVRQIKSDIGVDIMAIATEVSTTPNPRIRQAKNLHWVATSKANCKRPSKVWQSVYARGHVVCGNQCKQYL